MKRCPQCNRTFTDDALSFCLDDGSPLASVSAPSPSDSAATMLYPPPRETSSQPTMAFRPGQMPPPTASPWTAAPIPQPQKRSVWPWVLGIGAVLLFLGIGVVVLVIAIASITTNDNNNNSTANSNNNNLRGNRNANSNTSNSSANPSSTTSLPVSYSDDFSSQVWGTGTSKFGKTWYDNDEYHLHGNRDGYIVMYAPTLDYGTENATVRVTARNVDSVDTGKGYGILVHGQLKNEQLEDYGFLIDNGSKGYYRVIEHKSGAETQLVSWTSSSAIRTGTSPNQLEVRIRDRNLEFYINGQFVTSVTDGEGYLRGKVGFYASNTAEVAFDDLEISR